MKRLLILTLSLLSLGLAQGSAAGAEGDVRAVGQAELQDIFLDLATSGTALPRADLELTRFNVEPETIRLPTGALEARLLSGRQAKPLGQQVLVADLLVDGVAQGRVKLSGDLALFGEVICLASSLPRHTRIEAGHLQRVRRNLTMLGTDLVREESAAIGKELKTTLQAGAILYGNLLQAPEMVKRNDVVSILAASDSLLVSVPGRVQSAGALGELIKVKNLMSRKEVVAKVLGPGAVQAQ